MLMSASMSILVGTLALTWTAHTGLVTKVTLGDVSISGEGRMAGVKWHHQMPFLRIK